jgi:hypothetical protein
MNRVVTCLWLRSFAVVVGLVAASCGGGGIENPLGSSSDNLTSSELASIATSMLGPMVTGLQNAVSPNRAPGRMFRPFAAGPLETILIPYTAVEPSRVNCPAGGYYSQNGGVSGTANLDTGLVKVSGTILMVPFDCAYEAGTIINGDPYLSALFDYTQTGDPWHSTVTVSGGWTIATPGRNRTSVLIDPGGIHVTAGSIGPNRIQGSLTAYPGATSVSLDQTF